MAPVCTSNARAEGEEGVGSRFLPTEGAALPARPRCPRLTGPVRPPTTAPAREGSRKYPSASERGTALTAARKRLSGKTRCFPKTGSARKSGPRREGQGGPSVTEGADVCRREGLKGVVLGGGSRCLPKGGTEGRRARRTQPMFTEGRVAREQRGQRGRSASERAGKSRR
ncbi:unnamed protein product [Coccothraustes coccothraustes]